MKQIYSVIKVKLKNFHVNLGNEEVKGNGVIASWLAREKNENDVSYRNV